MEGDWGDGGDVWGYGAGGCGWEGGGIEGCEGGVYAEGFVGGLGKGKGKGEEGGGVVVVRLGYVWAIWSWAQSRGTIKFWLRAVSVLSLERCIQFKFPSNIITLRLVP